MGKRIHKGAGEESINLGSGRQKQRLESKGRCNLDNLEKSVWKWAGIYYTAKLKLVQQPS